MTVARGSNVEVEAQNKKVRIGNFTAASGDTSGSIATGLTAVDFFFMNGISGWTASGGTVTVSLHDPGATVAGSWIAFGH